MLYLDVWQWEVTYLGDPALADKAVGIDTTLRLQTAVRFARQVLAAESQNLGLGYISRPRKSGSRIKSAAREGRLAENGR